MNNGIQPDEAANTTPEVKTRGEFGMYTDNGNKAVSDIVTKVRQARSRYDMITDGDKNAVILLRALAKHTGFEEAADDVVKFIVFNKIRSRKI